jgi:hypothetical protein
MIYSCYSYPTYSSKTGICHQIFVNLHKIKFNKNLSGVLKLLHGDRWTDRPGEANRIIFKLSVATTAETTTKAS